MKLEELKQEAEQYSYDVPIYQIEPQLEKIQKAYLAGAEPREKRIAALEKEIGNLKKTYRKQRNKRIDDLQKENAELRKVAEFQQSSNMSRHFENKKLKEGLAVGSTLNKALNSMNKNLEEERDKYRNMVFDKDDQLTKAKELLKQFLEAKNSEDTYKAEWEAEQFLKDSEVEK